MFPDDGPPPFGSCPRAPLFRYPHKLPASNHCGSLTLAEGVRGRPRGGVRVLRVPRHLPARSPDLPAFSHLAAPLGTRGAVSECFQPPSHPRKHVASLELTLHSSLASSAMRIWIERLCSGGNIADEPSRDDIGTLLSMGAVELGFVFPDLLARAGFVPSCPSLSLRQPVGPRSEPGFSSISSSTSCVQGPRALHKCAWELPALEPPPAPAGIGSNNPPSPRPRAGPGARARAPFFPSLPPIA